MRGLYVSKCKRNILLVFGYLLIVIVLFIPYSKTNDFVEYSEGILWFKKEGFIFSPIFLYKKIIPEEISQEKKIKLEKYKSNRDTKIIFSKDWSKEKERFPEITESDLKKYAIRIEVLISEVAIVFLTTGFAYILFCVPLRKEKGGEG